MTPEVRAKELYNKLHHQICNDLGQSESDSSETSARQCASICCNEIISAYEQSKQDADSFKNPNSVLLSCDDSIEYWQQVKTHIQQL